MVTNRNLTLFSIYSLSPNSHQTYLCKQFAVSVSIVHLEVTDGLLHNATNRISSSHTYIRSKSKVNSNYQMKGMVLLTVHQSKRNMSQRIQAHLYRYFKGHHISI